MCWLVDFRFAPRRNDWDQVRLGIFCVVRPSLVARIPSSVVTMEISVTREIARPADEVFHYLADVSNNPLRSRSMVTTTDWLSYSSLRQPAPRPRIHLRSR